ncbi:molybdenum cofactor guanylyltransferase MobA [Hydrogenophaga sp. 5NK40-0174]|uniref:molybdenum cofactor guanylyltransferase MobA n=1 Tax=Hydrogenophaga sp. 5NK40-0174 TaxID=3127649 RepID=UPI0033404CF2
MGESNLDHKALITALVLAGGQSSRMGGADKGLQLLGKRTLVHHVIDRLSAQVAIASTAINANRHENEYGAFGLPLWPDDAADRPGPMAGIITGLERCQTPWLLVVPCDAPLLPLDLADRLLEAATRSNADIAMACSQDAATGREQPQPVFSLIHQRLLDSAREALANGERRVLGWGRQHRLAFAHFEDNLESGIGPFANANTFEELARLKPHLTETPNP